MKKITFNEFENFVNSLNPQNIYLLSSQILYKKIKKKQCFNNKDYGALEIILRDYMKRIDNNECKKR